MKQETLTPVKLCKAIRPEAEDRLTNLQYLIYRRWAEDALQLWWLVRSQKKRAFPLAKYFFRSGFDDDGQLDQNKIEAGLHIERGLGPGALEYGRDYVMDGDWVWKRSFVRPEGAQELRANVEQALPTPLFLRIEANSFVPPGSRRPDDGSDLLLGVHGPDHLAEIR